MKKIPSINATIMAANEKTRQAEASLGNAAADARDAKDKAEEAERIASNVHKVQQRCLALPNPVRPVRDAKIVVEILFNQDRNL